MLEQEIKLPFSDVETAREAVRSLAGRCVEARRLIDDTIFDSSDGRLAKMGATFRLRRDGDRAVLTAKGPILPGPVKSREELETRVGEAGTTEAMLAVIGYRPVFRSQKYREEYESEGVRLAIDDTPVGVFVEIEGPIAEIDRVSLRLGRTRADYCLDSYMTLWRRHGSERGHLHPADMLFSHPTPD